MSNSTKKLMSVAYAAPTNPNFGISMKFAATFIAAVRKDMYATFFACPVAESRLQLKLLRLKNTAPIERIRKASAAGVNELPKSRVMTISG